MAKASTCASASAMDGLLPPPPPPYAVVDPMPLAVDPNIFPPPAAAASSISLGSTILIITAVLGFSFVVCLFIRLGLRLRRSSVLVAPASVLSSTDPSNSAPEELTHKNNSSNSSEAIVSHLHLLELSSSPATHSKSSPDCAVCLHSFLPDEHIRCLPACGHAFHTECVDTWIRNSPSCPLCRGSVAFPPPPPSSAEAHHVKMTTSGSQRGSSLRSESRNLSLPPLLASPPRRRFYSTGSSIDNLTPEDVEAAMLQIWEQSDYEASASAYRGPSRQRNDIWEAMGGGGRRGCPMDSTDRRLSSRSPSFRSAASSFRHSIPSTDQEEDSGGEGGQDFSWNREAEEDLLSAVFRWITGA